MGCLCSKIMDESATDVLDYTTQGSQYEYLRPRGQIIVQIDEKFKVPVLILDFEGCATKYVRLWPYSSLQKSQFLNLDRTPLSTPSPSENSGYDSGYELFFSLKKNELYQ